jgi:hypothetical protein
MPSTSRKVGEFFADSIHCHFIERQDSVFGERHNIKQNQWTCRPVIVDPWQNIFFEFLTENLTLNISPISWNLNVFHRWFFSVFFQVAILFIEHL